jgi:hypothetical protein
MPRLACPRVPVHAIVPVAFDLVQHGMNPVRGLVLDVLHDFVGLVPLIGQGEVDGLN